MTLTRRRLLVGGGALAVSAALGACGSRPDHNVERGAFDSKYMKTGTRWTVSRPAGRPRVAIFCLHSKGRDHRLAFDDVHVPEAAAAIGLDAVVAAVDGGPDSYWHKRADGTDAMAMLLTEFVPMVDSLVGRLPRALMGWSMGGYGSLLAAERARDRFIGVAPTSPALWLSAGATAPGAFDDAADYRANDVFADLSPLAGMAVAVACGTADPFYPAAAALVGRMDFAHRAFFGPGAHNAAYWRGVAPAQLRVIQAAL